MRGLCGQKPKLHKNDGEEKERKKEKSLNGSYYIHIGDQTDRQTEDEEGKCKWNKQKK